MLHRGGEIARGHVVAQSCGASGNIIGRAHANSIMDTRLYQVEFTGGEVTELTTNVIAETMYTQCIADGNEYLLHDVLIDYCRDNKAISRTDWQITV